MNNYRQKELVRIVISCTIDPPFYTPFWLYVRIFIVLNTRLCPDSDMIYMDLRHQSIFTREQILPMIILRIKV